MSGLSRLLLLPRVAWLGARAPRDPDVGWDRFWTSVRSTGVGGDVLWDSGDDGEMQGYAGLMGRTMDPTLPIVDVGCGHGRLTSWLAGTFSAAVGVDRSAAAIRRASADHPDLRFEVVDATAHGAFDALATDLGDANVFVRGVFHVLRPGEQETLAENLLALVGEPGRVFLTETDHRGGSLSYLTDLGATPRHIPPQLTRAITNLPRPGAFGAVERARCFPADRWNLLEERQVTVETVPMRTQHRPERIPGYCAVLAPRA